MSDELVVLKVFDNLVEAGMVKSLLEANGITAFVRTADFGGMYPHFNLLEGVEVLVPEDAVDQARWVLEHLGDS